MCIGGTCYDLTAYYCCYTEDPPDITSPDWAQFRLNADFDCQEGLCTSTDSETGETSYSLARVKSGPHPTTLECDYICQRFACLDDSYTCVPLADGEHLTIEECSEDCAPTVSCVEGGGTDFQTRQFESVPGQTYASQHFTFPFEAGTIRVEYNAFSIPDRFQILAPSIDPVTGAVIARRIVKADSNYRGDQGSACEGLTVKGPGEGFIEWNKPEGICTAEIAVIAPCQGTGWQMTLSFEVNGAP